MVLAPSRLIAAIALLACAQTVLAEWQCHSNAPGIKAASELLLERAGRIYPSQLLGVLRSIDRVLLLNSNDDGWSERVRQALMELRLPEPDITAARRFQVAASGAAASDVPPNGEFVCLERERAARHGLTLTAAGEVRLASGKSVHLVDPYETAIVVEVKAVGSRPLDFREIIAMSGRSGIYAGLSSKRTQPSAASPVQEPGGAISVAIGPAGRPDGEILITPRESGNAIEDKVAATTVAAAAPAPVPAVAVTTIVATPVPATAVAASALVVEEPPARVASADVPATLSSMALPPEIPAAVEPIAIPGPVARAEAPAAPLSRRLPPDVPAAVILASAEPVSIGITATAPAVAAGPVLLAAASVAPPAQKTRAVGEQSYDDYANTMKTLMALRRSGGVRSISEMTYVHPAVEDLRLSRR